MSSSRPPKRSKTYALANATENKLHTTMDKLARFDDWEGTILPKLRQALAEGITHDKLPKLFASELVARQITIALTERDAGKANTAIDKILDRAFGKAVERQQITHRMAQASDEELDALLMSRIKEVDDSDVDTSSGDGSDEES